MMPKWLRLFFTDPKYKVRLIFLVFILIIFIFQGAVIVVQKKRIKANNKKIKKLIAMNEHQPIEAEPEKPKQVLVPVNEKYTFSGSFIEGNDSYVIINGEVYKKGSPLDQYLIDQISPQSVELFNPQTNERANLYYQYTEEEKALFGQP